MFIELLKDKSLKNVLLKADLDNETKELVESDSNITLIKESLIKNINPKNMISYRKYIKKAEEEEEDDDDKEIGIADDDSGEEDSLGTSSEDYLNSEERGAYLESAEIESDIQLMEDEKDAYKYLSELSTKLNPLQEIMQNARVEEQTFKTRKAERKKDVVVGGMKNFRKVGGSEDNSVKTLQDLRSIKSDNNYLFKEYGRLLIDGVLKGKDFKRDKETKQFEIKLNEKKDIDVKQLQDDFVALLSQDIEGKDILEIMKMLHQQQYGKTPKTMLNRGQRAREMRGMMMFAQGKSQKVAREYKAIKDDIKGLSSKTAEIRVKKDFVEEKIQEIEEIMQEPEKIVQLKIKRLRAGIMTLINSAGTKTDDVKTLMDRIKEMDNNKEKYIKEATREIQEDLETEQVKLKQYLITLSAADRLKEPLQGFRKIIGMFQENDPIDALKTKITRAGNIVIKLYNQAKGIEVFASRQEDGIEGGISAYLTDNPEVKLTLDADGLDFDGLPTVDAEAVRRMGEFEDKFNAKVDELQEIVNQLNYMIEGKGEEE
tara:strand:- start:22728 stop:24356 length:1629 start_codon:yes stop_codon:yes gene_type:complete